MRPANQIQIMLLEKATNNFMAEDKAHTSFGLAPALDVFVGVGPEQVAEQAGVGHVGRPHDFVDLVEVGELRGETAVHAQDLLVDQGGDRQAVEAVGHQLP